MPDLQPSASYSFTMRIHHPQRPGAFADVAEAAVASGVARRGARAKATPWEIGGDGSARLTA